jgi:hypothetical protein
MLRAIAAFIHPSNPAVCVVILLVDRKLISAYTAKMAAVAGLISCRLISCRINILDKMLATEGYFNRFRSCEIKRKNGYMPGHSAVYLLFGISIHQYLLDDHGLDATNDYDPA